MEKETANRCCIYARVSTEEQAERDLSIPFQLERCRYHAQGLGWQVTSEFVDAGESARTDKRPDFQKMISAARAREFDVILVHKFDRFARNDYDFVVYEKELEALGITLESVSEPGDASTPAGYIGRRMMQVISTWYSKNLAVEVKKGMLKKVEGGGWPKKAPLGYLNQRDGNRAWIEVDPHHAPHITEAFKEMATGKWTLKEWADQAYSLGYRSRMGTKIPKTVWSKMFHKRFYLGETYLKRGDIPLKGTHKPLVDADTFAQVQQVLREHDKHRQRSHRHQYLLRGLVYSVDAASPCWVETHPRKRISYYRSKASVNGSQSFYNCKEVERHLPNIIKGVTISQDTRKELRKELSQWFERESGGDGEMKRAEARLIKLEGMEKNLERLAMEEEIPFDHFREHRAQIEAERARLRTTVEAVRQRQHLVKADFEIALQLAAELDFLFEKGTFDERRLLCETVFKRLHVKDGEIVKADLNPPFALIARGNKGSEVVANGGDRGIRTPDPCDANAVLSQLSYIPSRAAILATPEWRVNLGCRALRLPVSHAAVARLRGGQSLDASKAIRIYGEVRVARSLGDTLNDTPRGSISDMGQRNRCPVARNDHSQSASPKVRAVSRAGSRQAPLLMGYVEDTSDPPTFLALHRCYHRPHRYRRLRFEGCRRHWWHLCYPFPGHECYRRHWWHLCHPLPCLVRCLLPKHPCYPGRMSRFPPP